jgi:hypothetical protein
MPFNAYVIAKENEKPYKRRERIEAKQKTADEIFASAQDQVRLYPERRIWIPEESYKLLLELGASSTRENERSDTLDKFVQNAEFKEVIFETATQDEIDYDFFREAAQELQRDWSEVNQTFRRR